MCYNISGLLRGKANKKGGDAIIELGVSKSFGFSGKTKN